MPYRESVVLFCHDAVMQTARTHFPADFADLTIGVNTEFLLSEKLMTPACKADVIGQMNAALLALRHDGQLARIEQAYLR